MKKLVLFLVCTAAFTFNGVAQKSVVSEVKNDIGGLSANTDTYKNALNKIKPAMTNPETAEQAETWYIAGKTAFGLYSKFYGDKAIGKAVDDDAMSESLLLGYDYYRQALKLDSIPEMDKGVQKVDKKTGLPKFKTKYSKEIVSVFATHMNDYINAGSHFYDKKDYVKAVKAWEVYTTLPEQQFMSETKFNAPDSLVGQIRFYQGIANWQNKDLNAAIKSFAKARAKGYTAKEAYDYPLACASELKDEAALVEICKEALSKYGKEDIQYISILINYYLNNKDFATAKQLVDEALATNTTAELLDLKGFILEQEGDNEGALNYYLKSVDVKPDYVKGLFDIGRSYYNKAAEILTNNPDLTGKALDEKVYPLYDKALPYLEKAFEADPTNAQVKSALINIYYAQKNEKKLNELENM